MLKIDGVASVIMPRRAEALAEKFPGRVGWIDWHYMEINLPDRMSPAVAALFGAPNLGLTVLRRMQARGVRDLGYYCHVRQRFVLRSIRAAMASRVANALAARALDLPPFRRLAGAMLGKRLRLAGLTNYRDEPFWSALFQYVQAECERRPPDRIVFDPGHVMLVTGSLGAGGSERQVAYTSVGLAGSVPKLSLAVQSTAAGGDFFLDRVEQAGVRVLEAPEREVLFLPSAWAPMLIELGRVLGHDNLLFTDVCRYLGLFADERPGLVHAWLDWSNIAAGVAAVIAGVPRIVLSGRSLAPTRFAFHQPFMRPGYRFLLESPGVTMLNNSRAGAADYAEWLGIAVDRITVIRNAIEDGEHRTPTPDEIVAYRARLGIPDGARVVGSVFRISEEKRPDLWIRIAAAVAAARPDVYFLLVGDGPDREATRAAGLAAGLGDRLVMPGRSAEPALPMALMECLLLTSRVEGLPNVLIEAQLGGVPVVTSAVGGAPEALVSAELSGFAIEGDDPQDYARAILRLIDDDGTLRARRRAELPILTRHAFDRERMLSETRAVYGR
ncbi:glycosyltransferase [Rhodoplanes azumiensis]|uniref:Glycosyltransferase n=1 Tax=Rhodoplanes azumiensis TaxID=1897628 RepID=A0ABW5AI73_9BRAD